MAKFFDKVKSFLGIDDELDAPRPRAKAAGRAKPKAWHDRVRREPEVIPPEVHGIDPSLLDERAVETVERLHRRGFEAYIVGGAVRDLMAGIRPKDFDVATNARPEEVKRCFGRALIIGRRFRIVHVLWGRDVVEVATFRSLGSRGIEKDSAGRVIDDNVFGEMWEDAARRDFTVNALFYDPETEEVLDYHDGVKDMRRKVLRVIGDPEERYREDPVRMMRAVRISCKLGFELDEKTAEPIASMARLLENVPTARLFDETFKLLTCGKSIECLERLQDEGLLGELLPVVEEELEQPEAKRFVLTSLAQTDERIRCGKHISPVFLFATLLWPRVRPLYGEFCGTMSKMEAMHEAAGEVFRTDGARIGLPQRLRLDVREIWTMQLRLERRSGHTPYKTLESPRFRASYDFLLLRVRVGEADEELAVWWDAFAKNAGSRADLIESTPRRRRTAESEQEGEDLEDGDEIGGGDDRRPDRDGAPSGNRRPRHRRARRRRPSGAQQDGRE